MIEDFKNLLKADEELVFEIDGEKIPATEAWVRAKYPDQADDLMSAATALESKTRARFNVRDVISQKVGDAESILGTTADAAQLALVAMIFDIYCMHHADDFAEYKQKKTALIAEFIGYDTDTEKKINSALISGQLISQLRSGDIILTAAQKGIVGSLGEIFTASTTVATIMQAVNSGV